MTKGISEKSKQLRRHLLKHLGHLVEPFVGDSVSVVIAYAGVRVSHRQQNRGLVASFIDNRAVRVAKILEVTQFTVQNGTMCPSYRTRVVR